MLVAVVPEKGEYYTISANLEDTVQISKRYFDANKNDRATLGHINLAQMKPEIAHQQFVQAEQRGGMGRGG